MTYESTAPLPVVMPLLVRLSLPFQKAHLETVKSGNSEGCPLDNCIEYAPTWPSAYGSKWQARCSESLDLPGLPLQKGGVVPSSGKEAQGASFGAAASSEVSKAQRTGKKASAARKGKKTGLGPVSKKRKVQHPRVLLKAEESRFCPAMIR